MATATMDGAHRARRQAGRVELGSSSPTSNASIGIRGGAAAMEHRRSLGVAMASWAKGAAMATASLRRSGAARRQRARGGERLEVLHGGGGRSSSARLQRRLSFSLSSRRVAAAPLLPPLLLSPARLLLFWPRGQLVWVRRWGVTVRRGSCQRGRRQDAQAAWRGRPRRIRARGARHRGGSGGGGRASSPPTALDGLVLELRRRSLGEGGAGPWSRRSTRRRRSSSVEHRISSSRRRRSSSVEHRTTEAAAGAPPLLPALHRLPATATTTLQHLLLSPVASWRAMARGRWGGRIGTPGGPSRSTLDPSGSGGSRGTTLFSRAPAGHRCGAFSGKSLLDPDGVAGCRSRCGWSNGLKYRHTWHTL
jgi:hypothetical protein